jgi:hypothetical protein
VPIATETSKAAAPIVAKARRTGASNTAWLSISTPTCSELPSLSSRVASA